MATSPHCYCQAETREPYMLQCQKCGRLFHTSCLKSGSPTSLEGDVFFLLTCTACSEIGEEECARMKLQWLQVVMLTLYNLQLSGNGKCGYFRWKEHICAFIDKYWTTFFGFSRKKTATWTGTVAGTLSAGCPQYFSSGAQELKEPGWWRLIENKPPNIEMITMGSKPIKRQKTEVKADSTAKVEGLRTRRSKTSFAAAMELKAKRSTTLEAKDIRKAKAQGGIEVEHRPEPAAEVIVTATKPEVEVSGSEEAIKTEQKSSVELEIMDQSSQMSHSSAKSDSYLTVQDLLAGDRMPNLLLMGDQDLESDSDFEVDPCSFTPPDGPSSPLHMTGYTHTLPEMDDILSSLDDKQSEIKKEPIEFKEQDTEEPVAMETDDCSMPPVMITSDHKLEDEDSSGPSSESESESDDSDQVSQVTETSQTSSEVKVKKKKKTVVEEPVIKEAEPNYVPVTVYEETQLLNRLNALNDSLKMDSDAQRLRRKLLLRKIKRERGLPLFDLDVEMYKIIGRNRPTVSLKHSSLNPYNVPSSQFRRGDYRILDRFQTSVSSMKPYLQQPVLFLNRLVGTEDDQLHSITSPYTARMLKPFIRRDYESKPLKKRLLEEIVAHHQRDAVDLEVPPSTPIDYCYVRPQHIASVNTLCREFFWPGIDLSECLQYPDFSCVVLYRKIVIGFSFMVPDVKYNEAYISFIFTHPEWRGAGIGTFMLYHLIQTCMGKDVTLHVSATNSAMLLYQKFGFKPEEFILDFYDKYYPANSKECKHAFYLRLRR